MKLRLLSLALILCASFSIKAQSIAINTDGSSANNSSILDIKSTTKGMLIPRMTNTQKLAISSPAIGLMIYQTDGTSGFYLYNGVSWSLIGAQGATGAQGVAGSQGATGAEGPKGATGAEGPKGATGTGGLTGPTGPAGPQGADGATGPQGPQGVAGASGTYFAAYAVNPASGSPFYIGVNSSNSTQTVINYRTIAMTHAGTFDGISLTGTITANAASNEITATLMKNGVATSLTVSITVSALGTTVKASNTTNTVAFVAGDLVELRLTQTNGTPEVNLGVVTHSR